MKETILLKSKTQQEEIQDHSPTSGTITVAKNITLRTGIMIQMTIHLNSLCFLVKRLEK